MGSRKGISMPLAERRKFTMRFGRAGQTFLESVLLLPLFLLLIFAALQTAHVIIAMAIVHYGASSAAHVAVLDNQKSGGGRVEDKFKSLLAVGLQYKTLKCSADQDPVTPNVTVIGCAELPSYPFVGLFLSKALSSSDGNDCDENAKSFGPIAVQVTAPYRFVLEGKAIARMNYTPT
jgi:hypothetical protein